MRPTTTGSLLAAIALWAVGAAAPAAAGPCPGLSPSPATALESVVVADNLPARPLWVTAPAGDFDRLFIVDQDGLILLRHRGDPPDVVSTFLDLTGVVNSDGGDEMGLLGLAFDPLYDENGYFYVNYTESDDPLFGPHRSVVARYRRSALDPDTADPGSEHRLLVFAQPETNHNGGQLLFGPDGMLYVATGDGGGSGDGHGSCGNGQNRSALLGKILRIDVREVPPPGAIGPDCGAPDGQYAIPSDNPFYGSTSACAEIWAWGLRNPWRSAFDAETGAMFITDVGQNCWEEINWVPPRDRGGHNFGWREMEGTHCFDKSNPSVCDPMPSSTCPTSCNDPDMTLPIHEYSHDDGSCSITGGPVYRGCLLPRFAGRYFFGDYCTGAIRSLVVAGGAATDIRDHTLELDPLNTLVFRLTSFGTDAHGEIYIANRDGKILKIVPPFPDLEVSAPGGAEPFRLGRNDWTWQDLAFWVEVPVSEYRIYRGVPGEAFRCIHRSLAPIWPGGDPDTPAPGGLFAYLVTAVAPDGRETSPGPNRTLTPDLCP